MTRGAMNLPLSEGKVIDQQAYDANAGIIAAVLCADRIENYTGGSIDLISGVDLIASVDQRQVGVALRCRRNDYGSITLNRHVSDPYSQIHTLLKTLSEDLHYIAPAFIVQINGLDENYKANGTVLRVNVRQFARHLQRLIDRELLDHHYNQRLKAYEFNEENLKGALSISGFHHICLHNTIV
jgi:hypothetical protein